MNRIRVLIIDDHELLRAGLRQLIASQGDMSVAGECQDGRQALQWLSSNPCDVLLLDISLPDISGIEVLRRIRDLDRRIAVLVLSGHTELQFGLNVLRAGANGFVSKAADNHELLRAIRNVAQGNRHIGQELANLLLEGLDGLGSGPVHELLSDREFMVLRKLAAGMRITDIADQLGLSTKTVSTYRTRVLEKMGLRTNADLTTYALKNKLLD
jgi:two-component system, NarL family, invasion response regulator UvrY